MRFWHFLAVYGGNRFLLTCATNGKSSGAVHCLTMRVVEFSSGGQRYTYRVLQTIQMKVILLWVWAEGAILGRAKTALKFKYEI